jgi:hypothetical protein
MMRHGDAEVAMRWGLVLGMWGLVFALSLGCGSSGGGSDGSDQDGGGETVPGDAPEADTVDPKDNLVTDGSPPDLPNACVEAAAWAPGTVIFRDATGDWGLHDLGVQGILVHVTELDGDGWPDLIIHHEGGNDVFGDDPSRVTWVLRNTEGAGFEDVTEASGFRMRRLDEGLNKGRAGQMIGSADVDNDGDLDVFTAGRFEEVSAVSDSSELMLNDGNGNFSFGPLESEARREGKRDFANSLSFVDFDRDGFIDLWVVNNVPIAELWNTDDQQDRLYQGMGNGMFTDVTVPLGLGTQLAYNFDILNSANGHSWGWAATACDLNNDGDPELLAASYGRTPNNLWLAEAKPEGGVKYINWSIESGYAFDDNQEWWLDLNARCHCLENPGDDECDKTEPPDATLCANWKAALGGYRWQHQYSRQPFMTGGVSASTECADLNNDGHMDLLTGEIVHPDIGPAADQATLLVNNGDDKVTFTRQDHNAIGLGRPFLVAGRDEGVMNNTVLDFDNDGWPDIYWSTSGYPLNEGLLYHQDAPLQFSQVTFQDGFRHFHSHGAQAVDLDRDGDLDLVVGALDSYCGPDWGGNPCWDPPTTRIYENLVGNLQNWVQLTLVGGPNTNRAAIGARVEVTAGGVTQTQEIDGGHGRYTTQRDMTLHFGLGAACEADITIRWPNAWLTEQSFTLAAGYRYVVTEGQEPAAVQ